jgi:phosphate transport system permease protein
VNGKAPKAFPFSSFLQSSALMDRLFHGFTGFMAFLILLLAAMTAVTLFIAALPSMRVSGWSFLTSSDWDPVKEIFGSVPFVYGTLVSSLIALVIATPLGLGISLFLTELAPMKFRDPVAFVVEILAAIPSVVYGLWGIFLLAPFMRVHVDPLLIKFGNPFVVGLAAITVAVLTFAILRALDLSERIPILKPVEDYQLWAVGILVGGIMIQPLNRLISAYPLFKGPSTGLSLFTAGVILSIMILPTITAISREVFESVPNSQRESARALGATNWETIQLAVLKSSKVGILGALMLALGRALGETMAVTMVIGNNPQVSTNLLGASHSMASVIANEFSEAVSDVHIAALAEIGLLLMVITFILNIVANLLVWVTTSKYQR